MKHTLGNDPRCKDCYWYREKEADDKCLFEGWCTCKKELATGINGRKREHPPERKAVHDHWCCQWWEDAEERLTHYEVMTRKPEPWRTPLEKEAIEKMMQR